MVRASAGVSARGLSAGGAPAIVALGIWLRTGEGGLDLGCVSFTRKANRLRCRKRVDELDEAPDRLSGTETHRHGHPWWLGGAPCKRPRSWRSPHSDLAKCSADPGAVVLLRLETLAFHHLVSILVPNAVGEIMPEHRGGGLGFWDDAERHVTLG